METKEAKAVVRTVRIAPRKVRLIVDLVRGKDINDAYAILRGTQRAASRPVEKLIKSAVANADHNFQLDPEKLYIKEIFVGEGKTLKRIQPRSRGRAFAILKRTSHIYITVAERE